MKYLFYLSFWPLLGFSQQTTSLPTPPEPPLTPLKQALDLSPHQNLFAHQVAFDDWRLENDLSKKRGWKAAMRFENELLKRINPQGQMPSGRVYLQALEHIKQMGASANARMEAETGWSPVGPFADDKLFTVGRVNVMAFHPTDANTFYVGFGQGGLWKTTNNGQSFTPIGDNLPLMRVSGISIDPLNPETVYITIGDMAYISYDLYAADRKRNSHYGLGVYKSKDGGKSFQPTGLSFKQTDFQGSLIRKVLINPRNTNELVAIGSSGIYKSLNGGDTWVQTLNEIGTDIEAKPDQPNVLVAATLYLKYLKQGRAALWRSEDFGLTWSLLNTNIPPQGVQRTELAFSTVQPNTVYALACDLTDTFHTLYRSDDGGKNFGEITSRAKGARNIVGDLDPSNANNAAGDYSYGQALYDLALLIDPANNNRLYAGGLTVAISNDAGRTWTQESVYGSKHHPDQHFFAYNPLNKTYYICNDGGIYATSQILPEDQTSWRFVTKGINATSFYRLSVSPINNRDFMAGAQDNNTFMSSNNGTNWRLVIGGDGMENLMNPNKGLWSYGSYQYGTIIGLIPKQPIDSTMYVFNPGLFRETGEWTTPYVYSPSDNSLLIGAGNLYKIPGGKDYRSAVKVSNLANMPNRTYPNYASALVQNVSNPQAIYMAKAARPTLGIKGSVLRSDNAGITFNDVSAGLPLDSYPSYLATNATNANQVWVTFSNFVENNKVYQSSDGGLTWLNISYNLPNVPANCIVHDQAQGMLYAALDLGVYTMPVGGRAWTPFLQNLPNVIVSELEINAETQKIYAATFGRGLWVTDLKRLYEEAVYQTEIILFPNPNQGSFVVRANAPTPQGVASITLIDVMGRELLRQTLTNPELNNGKKLDTTGLVSGLYFVRVEWEGKSKVIKMWVE